MKDPLATILLTLGFAVLLLDVLPFEPHPMTIIVIAMLSAGLAGLHRVLGTRAPLFLIAGAVAMWGLQHFWDLLPIDSNAFKGKHETLYATPAFLSNVVLVGLFAAIPIVARPRIGNGLMVLSLAALGMAVIAKGPLLVTEKQETATFVFGAIERGWFRVATRLVAIVFVVSAFDPKTTRIEKRGLVIVAVIGAALFAAVYDTLPDHIGGGNDGYYLLAYGALALAWVLSAIGFAGVARAGGGKAAWAAMGLSIAQLPLFVFGIAIAEKTRDATGAVGSAMFFGLLAIGLAGVTAPGMGARVARGFAGILALAALCGTLVSFALLVFAGTLGVREPFGPIHDYAIPIVGHAAVAWAASLAYLVAPPKFEDRVAA